MARVSTLWVCSFRRWHGRGAGDSVMRWVRVSPNQQYDKQLYDSICNGYQVDDLGVVGHLLALLGPGDAHPGRIKRNFNPLGGLDKGRIASLIGGNR